MTVAPWSSGKSRTVLTTGSPTSITACRGTVTSGRKSVISPVNVSPRLAGPRGPAAGRAPGVRSSTAVSGVARTTMVLTASGLERTRTSPAGSCAHVTAPSTRPRATPPVRPSWRRVSTIPFPALPAFEERPPPAEDLVGHAREEERARDHDGAAGPGVLERLGDRRPRVRDRLGTARAERVGRHRRVEAAAPDPRDDDALRAG